MKHKYNYFYKVINKINGHFYYGVHSTDDLNDGYMGSGTRLKKAIKKYGIDNFEKEIIKYCNNREEAYELESEYVTESLIRDNDCYNIILGGEQFNPEFLVSVKDSDGNRFFVHHEDPRYLSGELSGITRGFFTAIDDEGKTFKARKGDKSVHGITYGKLPVKDSSGKMFIVSKDDPRLISGELVSIWKDRKHSELTKHKISEAHKKYHLQEGEKNSQYGTCWITKNGENKKIKKEELDSFLLKGWVKGRTLKK